VLEFHLRAVQTRLLRAEGGDPVGFVIDGTDELGRVVGSFYLSEAKGITRQQAETEIDTVIAANRRPVIIFADNGLYTASLLRTLAMMDAAAGERFNRLRYHRPDNEYLVVVIAAGMFGCYQVPSGLASDGQNRTAVR
jgi:hypothetical protein